MDADFLEESRRLVLVNNERRKLVANALDRLSTAFVVVGVLGQILSLSPAIANASAFVVMAGWISAPCSYITLHSVCLEG